MPNRATGGLESGDAAAAKVRMAAGVAAVSSRGAEAEAVAVRAASMACLDSIVMGFVGFGGEEREKKREIGSGRLIKRTGRKQRRATRERSIGKGPEGRNASRSGCRLNGTAGAGFVE